MQFAQSPRDAFTETATPNGRKWSRETSDGLEILWVHKWNGKHCVQYSKAENSRENRPAEEWRKPGFETLDDAVSYARYYMMKNGGVHTPD